MAISLFEAIIYGVIAGFTEFMPVSSYAHGKLLLTIFGTEEIVPLLDLFVHIGLLIAVLASSISNLKRGSHEYNLLKKSPRRRKREPNMQVALDFGFVKMAAIPAIVGAFLRIKTVGWLDTLPMIALFFFVNSLLLFVPRLISSGNKDSRNMSSFDGLLFGIGAGLSALPGISCVGASSAVALCRGADAKETYKWSLMLLVPVLAMLLCLDLYGLFLAGLNGLDLLSVLICILSGCAAYFTGSLAITLMKTLTANSRISVFAYYSCGAALFAFILYLY